MEKLLFSVIETAQMLGISRSKLYREMTEGKLQAVKVGKLRRITRQAIQDWLDHLPKA